jgi:hypothetical protein
MTENKRTVAHDCDEAGCAYYCAVTRQRRLSESQLLAKLDRAIEAVAERTAGSDYIHTSKGHLRD